MKYLVTIRQSRRFVVEAPSHDDAMELAVYAHRTGDCAHAVKQSPNVSTDYAIEQYSEGASKP